MNLIDTLQATLKMDVGGETENRKSPEESVEMNGKIRENYSITLYVQIYF